MKNLRHALLGLTVAVSALAGVPVLITGAGSTFVTPMFSKWFAEYGRLHPDVQFSYQSVGSGAGVRDALERKVDFGASDAPLTDAEQKQAPDLLNLPVVLGSVAVVYNVAGVQDLKLTAETLAGIFLHSITKWNDPAIAKDNPGTALPDTDIEVVHRSDGSGTTAIFTDYLSKVSPEWKRLVGAGKHVNWPTGLGGKGNEGVSSVAKDTPGSIAYVELAFADRLKLATSLLRNNAGAFVRPSIESTTAAAAGVVLPEDMRVSITDAPGPAAWPISGFTYVLLRKDLPEKAVGEALLQFLQWAVSAGQTMTASLDYAPLPQSVVDRVRQKLASITVQGTTIGAK